MTHKMTATDHFDCETISIIVLRFISFWGYSLNWITRTYCKTLLNNNPWWRRCLNSSDYVGFIQFTLKFNEKYIGMDHIYRLNSGNLGIFYFTELMINLDSSVCRAWKIISNDTKITMVPWESDIKNSFWNICVGVWVSGQPRANFF